MQAAQGARPAGGEGRLRIAAGRTRRLEPPWPHGSAPRLPALSQSLTDALGKLEECPVPDSVKSSLVQTVLMRHKEKARLPRALTLRGEPASRRCGASLVGATEVWNRRGRRT